MRRAAKTDENQQEIVKGLRKVGAVVLVVSALKNCFDILVFFRGLVFPMEIKNPDQAPSKQKLTKGEAEFKEKIESVGVKYNIVKSLDDAIDVLNKGKK